MNTRAHVVIPSSLLAVVDRLVGKRGRSQFIADATAKEVMRRAQLAALEGAVGSWKAQDHPELKGGVNRFVRGLRSDSDRRLGSAKKGK